MTTPSVNVYEYATLDPASREGILRNRLLQLEREHFVETVSETEGDTEAAARRSRLEERIAKVKGRLGREFPPTPPGPGNRP